MRTNLTYPTHLPRATYIAACAALAACLIGVRWGTWAAGGSDSSCYLNEARLLSRGAVQIEEPLILSAPWPDAAATFTPAGFRPSMVRPDAIVPICSPGLPMLMAIAATIRIGPMLIVPLCGALAVWSVFLLGRRLGGGAAGAASAVLLAASPAFLFQVVQPMTDVPAAAWWLLVVVLAGNDRDASPRPQAAGLAAGAATLIRPNLLPLALIVGIHLFRVSPDHARSRSILRFMVGLAPALVALGLFQQAVYGSPVRSGYGTTADLFRAENILPNIQHYGRWLYDTHTPLLALGLAAPFVLRRLDAWLYLIVAAATIAAYLPYHVFEAWWYLRFVLLAIAMLIVLSSAAVAAIAQRAAPRYHVAIVTLVAAVLAVMWVRAARDRAAFELQTLERPFIDAGMFVARRLPERAALVTLKYSGSVHYYAGRPTVSWDTLAPASLDTVLAFLRDRGYVPMLLVDASEEVAFRDRFGGSSETGRLDWPPLARVGRTVRVYDPADRARYLAGTPVNTIDDPRVRR